MSEILHLITGQILGHPSDAHDDALGFQELISRRYALVLVITIICDPTKWLLRGVWGWRHFRPAKAKAIRQAVRMTPYSLPTCVALLKTFLRSPSFVRMEIGKMSMIRPRLLPITKGCFHVITSVSVIITGNQVSILSADMIGAAHNIDNYGDTDEYRSWHLGLANNSTLNEKCRLVWSWSEQQKHVQSLQGLDQRKRLVCISAHLV